MTASGFFTLEQLVAGLGLEATADFARMYPVFLPHMIISIPPVTEVVDAALVALDERTSSISKLVNDFGIKKGQGSSDDYV